MISFERKDRYTYEDLLHITALLRSENGCPWDKEQTHESIRKNFVEEVYEAIEAIERKDNTLMTEELGDVLFQVVFHAQMAHEEGAFSMDDVVDGICKKLVFRHPHVFDTAVAENTEQVLTSWDAIKKKAKGMETQAEVMEHISEYLPALMRSSKVQEKAAKVGFDFAELSEVYDKIAEETEEVKQAQAACRADLAEEEIGDLLFSVVNLARKSGVDAELALKKSCKKFINRFKYVENSVQVVYNSHIQELSVEKLDSLWCESKKCDHRSQKKG